MPLSIRLLALSSFADTGNMGKHYFYNWKQLQLKKTTPPYVSVPEVKGSMTNSKTKGAHE